MLECELKCKLKPFRIYSIDTNPNYNGWVVVDWFSDNEFRIVDYGVESFEELNKAEDELKKKTRQGFYWQVSLYREERIRNKL